MDGEHLKKLASLGTKEGRAGQERIIRIGRPRDREKQLENLESSDITTKA